MHQTNDISSLNSNSKDKEAIETSNSKDKGNTSEKGFTTTWMSNRRVFCKKVMVTSAKKVMQ